MSYRTSNTIVFSGDANILASNIALSGTTKIEIISAVTTTLGKASAGNTSIYGGNYIKIGESATTSLNVGIGATTTTIAGTTTKVGMNSTKLGIGSSATTINIANTSTTTLNIGTGAATTTLGMGAGGTTNIRGNTAINLGALDTTSVNLGTGATTTTLGKTSGTLVLNSTTTNMKSLNTNITIKTLSDMYGTLQTTTGFIFGTENSALISSCYSMRNNHILFMCSNTPSTYYSNDGGVNWIKRAGSTGMPTANYYCVATDDNGHWVSCGLAAFAYSTTGLQFIASIPPSAISGATMQYISYEPSLGAFISPSSNGYVAFSYDFGVSWILSTQISGKNLISTAYNPTTNTLAVNSLDGYIYTSTDLGTNWSAAKDINATNVNSKGLFRITYINKYNMWVATQNLANPTNSIIIYTSTNDWTSWSSREITTSMSNSTQVTVNYISQLETTLVIGADTSGTKIAYTYCLGNPTSDSWSTPIVLTTTGVNKITSISYCQKYNKILFNSGEAGKLATLSFSLTGYTDNVVIGDSVYTDTTIKGNVVSLTSGLVNIGTSATEINLGGLGTMTKFNGGICGDDLSLVAKYNMSLNATNSTQLGTQSTSTIIGKSSGGTTSIYGGTAVKVANNTTTSAEFGTGAATTTVGKSTGTNTTIQANTVVVSSKTDTKITIKDKKVALTGTNNYITFGYSGAGEPTTTRNGMRILLYGDNAGTNSKNTDSIGVGSGKIWYNTDSSGAYHSFCVEGNQVASISRTSVDLGTSATTTTANFGTGAATTTVGKIGGTCNFGVGSTTVGIASDADTNKTTTLYCGSGALTAYFGKYSGSNTYIYGGTSINIGSDTGTINFGNTGNLNFYTQGTYWGLLFGAASTTKPASFNNATWNTPFLNLHSILTLESSSTQIHLNFTGAIFAIISGRYEKTSSTATNIGISNSVLLCDSGGNTKKLGTIGTATFPPAGGTWINLTSVLLAQCVSTDYIVSTMAGSDLNQAVYEILIYRIAPI